MVFVSLESAALLILVIALLAYLVTALVRPDRF